MGGKKSSAAAPAPVQRVPDESIAQSAAEKALAARGDVTAAAAGEQDQEQRRQGVGLASAKPRKPRPERDPGAMIGGDAATSAVITG